jgi:hypothetical protein
MPTLMPTLTLTLTPTSTPAAGVIMELINPKFLFYRVVADLHD